MDVTELNNTIARLQKDLQEAQEEIQEKDKEITALTQQNKALSQHIKALSEKQANSGTAEPAGGTERSTATLSSENNVLQTALIDKIGILQAWMENAKNLEAMLAKIAGENVPEQPQL